MSRLFLELSASLGSIIAGTAFGFLLVILHHNTNDHTGAVLGLLGLALGWMANFLMPPTTRPQMWVACVFAALSVSTLFGSFLRYAF